MIDPFTFILAHKLILAIIALPVVAIAVRYLPMDTILERASTLIEKYKDDPRVVVLAVRQKTRDGSCNYVDLISVAAVEKTRQTILEKISYETTEVAPEVDEYLPGPSAKIFRMEELHAIPQR